MTDSALQISASFDPRSVTPATMVVSVSGRLVFKVPDIPGQYGLTYQSPKDGSLQLLKTNGQTILIFRGLSRADEIAVEQKYADLGNIFPNRMDLLNEFLKQTEILLKSRNATIDFYDSNFDYLADALGPNTDPRASDFSMVRQGHPVEAWHVPHSFILAGSTSITDKHMKDSGFLLYHHESEETKRERERRGEPKRLQAVQSHIFLQDYRCSPGGSEIEPKDFATIDLRQHATA